VRFAPPDVPARFFAGLDFQDDFIGVGCFEFFVVYVFDALADYPLGLYLPDGPVDVLPGALVLRHQAADGRSFAVRDEDRGLDAERQRAECFAVEGLVGVVAVVFPDYVFCGEFGQTVFLLYFCGEFGEAQRFFFDELAGLFQDRLF